jgi:hypothetical protein
MKGQAEKTLLTAGADTREGEKGCALKRPVAASEDPNPTRMLLDDEDTSEVIGRSRKEDRTIHCRRHPLNANGSSPFGPHGEKKTGLKSEKNSSHGERAEGVQNARDERNHCDFAP